MIFVSQPSVNKRLSQNQNTIPVVYLLLSVNIQSLIHSINNSINKIHGIQ